MEIRDPYHFDNLRDDDSVYLPNQPLAPRFCPVLL